MCVGHSPEALGVAAINEAVLAFALVLGKATRAELHLVHVADPEPAFVEHEADTPEQRAVLARALRATHVAVEGMAAALRTEGIATTPHVIRGRVADAILERTEKLAADAIIVGSNGHNRARSLLLGSVTDALLRRSTVPVIVVPGPHDPQASGMTISPD